MQALNEKKKKNNIQSDFHFFFRNNFLLTPTETSNISAKKKELPLPVGTTISTANSRPTVCTIEFPSCLWAHQRIHSFSTSFFFFFSIFVSFNLMCIIKKSISLDRLCEIMKWWLRMCTEIPQSFSIRRESAQWFSVLLRMLRKIGTHGTICVCVCVCAFVFAPVSFWCP